MLLLSQLLAATCLWQGTSAPTPSPEPESVPLRINVKPSDRFEFDMRVEMRQLLDPKVKAPAGMEMKPVSVNYLLAERAVEVKSDLILWSRYLRPEIVKADGENAEAVASALAGGGEITYRMQTDLQNKPVALVTERGATPTSSSPDVVFPKDPVSVRGSWTGSYGSETEIQAKYTLLSIEAEGARRTAVIGIANATPSPEYQIEKGSYFAIDLADGRWRQADVALEITAEGAGKLWTAFRIQRRGWPALAITGPERPSPSPSSARIPNPQDR